MNTIKLDKGIVHLFLPFRFAEGWPAGENTDNIWEKTTGEVFGLDIFLEYVRVFFSKNSQYEKIDETACLILKLKKEALPVKMFNNKNLWVSNRPFDNEEKRKNAFTLPVQIDPLSFRIICHPFTSVGILTYSVEMTRTSDKKELPDLSDFIRLNYLLRSFSKNDEAFFISQNNRPEERKKASILLDIEGPGIFRRAPGGDVETAGWRPSHLLTYLLDYLNNKYKIEFFNSFHFIPFSYLQTNDEIKDASLISLSLYYLRKIYDFDYQPAAGSLEGEGEVMQPFRQIYYACSLEGGVIFNNSQPSDPEFIKRFHSTSFPKSQWLFVLGLLQRSFFIQLLNEVYEIDPDDHHKVKEYLRRYASISFKAIFSKVSVYHQHNDFYDLIISNFHIRELRTEIKDELNELNNMLRQFHEDEVEKHEVVEKQYNKRLNLILFILSVIGLMEVTYTIVGSNKLPLFAHILAVGVPVMLGIAVWNIITIRKRLK